LAVGRFPGKGRDLENKYGSIQFVLLSVKMEKELGR
jgi:hypothetical protein